MRYRTYKFLVEINGITKAGFQECSCLSSITSPTEYRDGTDASTVRILPYAHDSNSNITFRRGIMDSAELQEWIINRAEGNPKCVQVAIILLDETGSENLRWNVRNVRPIKWKFLILATGNEIAIEELEFIHDGFYIA